MKKKQLIGTKPRYFRGQLLLEDDFIAEQTYHAKARYRHSLNLHGYGIVRGLDVTPAGESSVNISPGFAIDGNGHEIEIREVQLLDLSAAPVSILLSITLIYEDEQSSPDNDEQRYRQCYGVLAASPNVADGEILLATVQLNERGKVVPELVNTSNRRELPGISGRGWVRTPFRPTILLPDKNKKNAPPPPPFLVGATRAEAQDDGAGGTMAITLAPNVIRIHKLRIAGEENRKGIAVTLWIGGWDHAKMKHVKRAALMKEIGSESPFDNTYDIAVADGEIDPSNSTLSLEIRSAGLCFISLVSVEVSYRGPHW
jgi:hypothetical protein